MIRRLLKEGRDDEEKGMLGATSANPLEIHGITSAEFAPFVEVLYQEYVLARSYHLNSFRLISPSA